MSKDEIEQAVVNIITRTTRTTASRPGSEVGSRLLRQLPDFDVRSYGIELLSKSYRRGTLPPCADHQRQLGRPCAGRGCDVRKDASPGGKSQHRGQAGRRREKTCRLQNLKDRRTQEPLEAKPVEKKPRVAPCSRAVARIQVRAAGSEAAGEAGSGTGTLSGAPRRAA